MHGRRVRADMGREREQLKAKLGVVVHAFNPSSQEAKAGGSQVGSQPGLHRKILSLKKENKTDMWASIEHKLYKHANKR
jgi:hypothetical protein